MKYLVTLACLLVLVVGAEAEPKNKVIGDWSGKLKIEGRTAEVLLHVRQGKDGKLMATLDSLSENALDIPVEAIQHTGSNLHFEIEGGSGVFDGKVAGDGAEVAGTWKQSGKALPLNFTRVSEEYVRSVTPHPVRVAFVISDNFNMIDFAGPWEVFQDAMSFPNGQMRMLMTVYTVSEKRAPVQSTGGATLVPQYTFDDAPRADIVVIGAQNNGSKAVMNWLRKQNAAGVTLMSVCTGAAKLAATGLLDGHSATTHHDYVDAFRKRFPKVQWEGSRRWVRATENVYTAGGLTSGIDLALHLLDKRFGREVAQATADYMEYHGSDWKQAP